MIMVWTASNNQNDEVDKLIDKVVRVEVRGVQVESCVKVF